MASTGSKLFKVWLSYKIALGIVFVIIMIFVLGTFIYFASDMKKKTEKSSSNSVSYHSGAPIPPKLPMSDVWDSFDN